MVTRGEWVEGYWGKWGKGPQGPFIKDRQTKPKGEDGGWEVGMGGKWGRVGWEGVVREKMDTTVLEHQ